MKKTTRLFFAVTILILTLLTSSCKIKDKNDNKGNGDNSSGTISKVTVVFSSEEYEKATANKYDTFIMTLYNELLSNDAFADATYTSESSAAVKYEIVVGNTNREISSTAYSRLSRVEPPEDAESYLFGYGRWIVYSKDGSVAVAYDYDEELAAAKTAIDALVNGYLSNDKYELRDGVLASGIVDYYEIYNRRDQEALAAQWKKLEAKVGTEITAALRNLYGIYSDDMITWMANLWEPYTCVCTTEECTKSSPYCGGSAFYYSNSGRDTEGFLPDSESTRQILYFLESSGMIGNYAKELPEDMRTGIVRFLKSLQDPESGYFYHPQWGDAISDSRRGRDLNDCTNMLTKFGSAPTYNAPNGVEGDGLNADGTPVNTVSPTSSLTGRLGTSAVKAASKVMATASGIPSHLENKESFEKYLKELDIRGHSYNAGNTLSAQLNEIKQRDEVLKKSGANYSLVKILMDFLNENQNPDTGNWHWPEESDQTSAYYANNGVLKITIIYNGTGTLIPNYDKLIKGSVDTLLSEEDPGAVVDIYNVWYALSGIKGNIENYGGFEANAHLAAFREEMLANGVTLIDATREKLSIFLKPDGSFSYTPMYSASNSQSATVALPQSEEGDVNATTICSTGTLSTMFNALGIADLRPKLYTSVDYMRLTMIIDGLDKVIKDEVPPFEVETAGEENKGKGKYYSDSIGFDGRLSDLVNQGVLYSQDDKINFERLNVGTFVSTATVSGDKVMVYGKRTGGTPPYLYLNLLNGKNGNAFVFETDICLIGGSTSYEDGSILQFWLDDENITNSSMWWNGSFSVKKEEAIVEKGETILHHSFSPTMKKHTFSYGTWHNIRIEVQDSGSIGSEVRFYIDNVLTNRLYVSETNSAIDHLTIRFRGDSGVDSVVLFDNLFFGSFESIPADDTELIPDNIEIYESADIIANGEIRGSGVYASVAESYSDTNLTTLSLRGRLGSQDGRVTFDKSSSGHYAQIRRIFNTGEALMFGTTTTSDPYLFFYAEGNEDESDKSLVFETDFAFMSGTAPGRSDDLVMQMYASKTEAVSYWYALGLSIKQIDGKYYLCGTDLQLEFSTSTWYNIRLEVDDTATSGSEARIYINGNLMSTFATTSVATYVPNMMIRFMSQCKDGRVYFDNTYFRAPIEPPPQAPTNPPTGNETDYLGQGAFYEKSEKYEGRTHEALISDGIMALNTARGTGDKRTLSFSDGALHYTSTGSSWGALDFVKQDSGEGIVFETDIRLSGVVCSADRPIAFVGTSNNGTGSAGIYSFTISISPYNDKKIGGYMVKIADNTEDIAWIPDGVWVNIRYEFDSTASGTTAKLLINGETVLEATSTKSISGIAGVELFTYSTNSSGGGFTAGTLSLDNTYMGVKVVKEPENPTNPPENPDDGEDEGGESGDDNSGDNGNTPIVPPEGDESARGSGDYKELATSYNGTTYSALVSDGTITEVNAKTTATVENVDGDGALKIVSQATNWSRYSIKKVGTSEDMVFETDLMIENYSSSVERCFYIMPTSDLTADAKLYAGYLYLAPSSDGNGFVLYLLGAEDKTFTFKEGKWVNIRVEYDALTLGATMRLIVNGKVISEVALTKSIANVTGLQLQLRSASGGNAGVTGTIYLDNTYLGAKITKTDE